MGSSKKHKDKDRERKHKRRHRSKDRSRSKSKERKHRDKSSRSGKSESSKRRKIDPELEYTQAHDVKPSYARHEEDVPTSGGMHDPSEAASDGKSNLSLSIEETNKLRAKLGLKPLDAPGGREETVKKEDEDVHVPAVNLGEQKRSDNLREKMKQAKERRRINEKMGKLKPLAALDSDEDDDVSAWVSKNRKIEKEKVEAEKRAKMLEEMDNEFGIGNLVEAEFGQKKAYGSKDLKGLKIEHSHDSFVEGKTIILTLKDQGILDDDGDTLINVNMLDDEHAVKNVENKKRKPDYRPYDEPEYDEYGTLKQKDVLDKYDEEIYGAKKESFEIGGGGRYNAEHERFMKKMVDDIRQQKQELSLPPPALASEFYTPEEMASFKKPRKKKKVPTATLR